MKQLYPANASFGIALVLFSSFIAAFSGCSLQLRSELQSQIEDKISATELLATVDSVADSWEVVGGATTIDIEATLHESGTLYYVVYDTDPGAMTAQQIKTAAQGATGGSLIRVGTIPITTSYQDVTTSITGLGDDTTYYVKVAAEGDLVGLYPDSSVRSFTQVNPDQLFRTNFTSVSFTPNITARYMTYLPEAAYKEGGGTFPVLIWLHGNGENAGSAGVDTDANFETIVRTVSGPMQMLESGVFEDLPMIVIQTRCPAYADPADGDEWDCWNWFTETELIDEVLENAKQYLRVGESGAGADPLKPRVYIDDSRVYIAGVSTGGAGSVEYARTYPSKIAAVVPTAMAGVNPALDASDCAALADIPFWFFHNDTDSTQGSVNSVNAKAQLEACAYSAERKLTRYDSGGHASAGTKTFNLSGDDVIAGDEPYQAPTADIYSWLLNQSK